MISTIKRSPPQKLFMQHSTQPNVRRDYRLFQGGFGSGKTFIAALLHIKLCLENPGFCAGLYAPTIEQLRGTILKGLLDLFSLLGMAEGTHYTHHKTHNIITFNNGSTMELKGLYDNTGVSKRGRNFHAVHVEEIAGISKEEFYEVDARLRAPLDGMNIKLHLFTMNTNPHADPAFWANDLFRGVAFTKYTKYPDGEYRETKGLYDESKIDYYQIGEKFSTQLDDLGNTYYIRYMMLKAASATNKMVDDAYVKGMLANFDEETANRLVLGETPQTVKNVVNHAFTAGNCMPLAFDNRYPLYLCCDFNTDPNCWVLAQYINHRVYFYREMCRENCPTPTAVEFFWEDLTPDERAARIFVTGDATAWARKSSSKGSDYAIIEDYLISVGADVTIIAPHAQPPVNERVRAMNKGFSDAQGVKRVYLDPDKCPHLYDNCLTLKYDARSPDGIYTPSYAEIQRKQKLKFVKHIWDAAGYMVHQKLDGNNKPVRGHTTWM